jgi:hypothetical protein
MYFVCNFSLYPCHILCTYPQCKELRHDPLNRDGCGSNNESNRIEQKEEEEEEKRLRRKELHTIGVGA